MEPIVSVLKIDVFVLGTFPGPKTWPRGTLLKIYPPDGDKFPDGSRPLLAVPLAVDEREGGTSKGPQYTLSTKDNATETAARIGKFIHSPNVVPGAPGTHLTIHFTPFVDSAKTTSMFDDRGGGLVILAEPITVGDSAHPTIGGDDVKFCGPVYISAAVGGVTDLEWPTDTYPNTFAYDKASIDNAYAGAPVYLSRTDGAGEAPSFRPAGSLPRERGD